MRLDKIRHPSHPKHKLKFERAKFLFRCDGCKEIGTGDCYRCDSCDFDLHICCAIPSKTAFHHFYPNCSFEFLSRPPGKVQRFCNACEQDVTGFVYHSQLCGFDLHPCCFKLPEEVTDGIVKLYLCKKVSAPCHKCGRKGEGWSYQSKCKTYNLHVACVREMLKENGPDIHRGCRKARNLETRIPSLKNTLQTHRRRSKGKVKKWCEVIGLAVHFIIRALLGDLTTLIAGTLVSMM